MQLNFLRKKVSFSTLLFFYSLTIVSVVIIMIVFQNNRTTSRVEATAGQAIFQGLTATISGNLIVGNTGVIQPAYGPLQLQYKSGLNSYTTGLFLQDTTGNIGIGTTLPSQRLDIQGGNLNTSGAILTSGTQRISNAGALSNVTGNVSLFTNDMGYVTSAVPAGAVMHFNLSSCPSGWTDKTSSWGGMYIVNLPSSGTLAATVGTALTNTENRPVGQHTHSINDPGHGHNIGYWTAYGGPASGGNSGNKFLGSGWYAYLINTSNSTTGITINNAGSVAGTNAPYVQLLVCQKN